MKKCTKCLLEKPFSEFPKRSNRESGIASWCKKCFKVYREKKKTKEQERARQLYGKNKEKYKEKHLKKKYGMTLADLNQMVLEQNNLCPICEKEFTEENPPHVDHDHDTLDTRALLHMRCNTGIGLLGDNPENLDRAAKYLRSYNEKNIIINTV